MSVPAPKAADAKTQTRSVTLGLVANAPLRIIKELLKNTGILQVEGNFDFEDFEADCPSPLPMWTGGCKFRVPAAPSAEDEQKPSPHLTLSLDKEQMDFSSGCVDYVDFRWPEGVEVFAAAHPLDEIPREQLSANPDVPIVSSVSNPAVAFPIPTAPGQLVLSLEFGRSYFLSVDPKYVHPSDPSSPAETPAPVCNSDVAPGLQELPLVGIFTSHAVPFTSGPGQVPGWSQHDSDRTDHWGAVPFWWFAETSHTQWERPCMFLPALNVLPFSSDTLPGLTKDTPASNSVNLSCDVSFCFASPDTIFIFAEYHVAHMSCRVVIAQSDENGAGTNITSDFISGGSEIKVTFFPYNTSPDTYEDLSAVSVVPKIDGSSLKADLNGNFCCRYIRVRVTVTCPSFFAVGSNAVVLLRDVKFFGEALWKTGDWIGSSIERSLTICRDDASLGFRKAQNEDFSWLTYSQLSDRVKAIQRLFAHFDKDGISVLAPCVNCVDMVAVKLACFTTGNTVIPVSSPVETRILEHYLNQTRPTIVFFDFAFAKKIYSLILKGEFALSSFPHVMRWLYCVPENMERGAEEHATGIGAAFQLWSDCPLTFPSNPPHPAVVFKDVADRDCFIFYTSGSTGLPKGVPRTFQELEGYMNAYTDSVKSVHLAAMPLSHMSEGTSFLVSLLRGNRVAMPTLRYSDAAGLTIVDQFSDLQSLKPSYVSSVPRFFEIVQRMFFDEIASLTSEGMESSIAKATVTAQYRNGKIFGKQLRGMFWGSAPISPQLEAFLREVWGPPHGPLSMGQGYGSSECGTITSDMMTVSNIVALLVESEDSGSSLEFYRGEVVVHTLTVAKSYLHASENPSFINNIDLDVQGPLFGESWTQTLAVSPLIVNSSEKNHARFFCTGDLGESSGEPPASEVQRAVAQGQAPAKPSQIITLDSSWGKHAGRRAMLVPPGCKLNVVGRLKNVVKMPNGEFVAPEYIEGCLAKVDIVEQICVFTRSTHSFVVAVIVPKDLSLCDRDNAPSTLMHALVQAAQELALPAYMIPRQIYISNERWSATNGMMTHNEKLNRAGVVQHYASVIDGLFAAGESGPPNQVLDSVEVSEGGLSLASVIRTIQTVSKSALNITATTDISSPEVLGGDSLTIMLLISKLNSVFRIKLSPAIMFELKTVNDLVNYMAKAQQSSSVLSHATSSVLLRDLFDLSLSQFISEAASGCSEEVVSLAVSAAAAQPITLSSGDTSVSDLSQCKDIFLSGVTGFLGCHLLQDLINNSSANVHCLVRAPTVSPNDAKTRLDSCLRKYNVDLTSEQFARVIVHNGDLTLPLFGLTESQFLLLSESLDAIVHNGAHVNWIMTYAQLRPANVMGTSTALHLAFTGKRKSFVHISTLSVSEWNSVESAPLSPQHCLAPGQGGYMQSKFIAERLVRAASVQGVPVTIIRPGTIVGHTTTGAANATDYAPSIISAFAGMREYVGSDGRFDLNPVDMVARASVLLSLQSSSKDLRVFHLVDACKASNSQVGRAAAGAEGRELSFAEFKASVLARLDSGSAANGAETLKPFLSFLETDAFFAVQRPYHSSATVAALHQLGLDWQCDSSDCVKRIVSFLKHRQ